MISRVNAAAGRLLPRLLPGLLLLLLAACDARTFSGSPTADTHAYVGSNFRSFVDEHGGLLGAPASVPLREPASGREVQYFAHARLEYDEGRDEVLVSDLGRWAVETAPTRTPPQAPLGVAEAFERYYAAQGGRLLLGEPLGEVILEDERWVQYYANVRLEWDPARPAGHRVQPARLGQAHFLAIGQLYPESGIDDARPSDNLELVMVDLQAHVTRPVVFAGDSQRLVITVRDLTGEPRDDIAVDATLRWDDQTRPVLLERTDENGLTSVTLNLEEVPSGTWVTVVATATFGRQHLGETRLRFQVWW